MAREITQVRPNWPFLFSAVEGRPGLVRNVPEPGAPRPEQFTGVRRVAVKQKPAPSPQVTWNFKT